MRCVRVWFGVKVLIVGRESLLVMGSEVFLILLWSRRVIATNQQAAGALCQSVAGQSDTRPVAHNRRALTQLARPAKGQRGSIAARAPDGICGRTGRLLYAMRMDIWDRKSSTAFFVRSSRLQGCTR